MTGTITIDDNRCKGCELCTFVCPKKVVEMADYFTPRGYRPARLVDPRGECTGCLLCSTICPDVAITVYRERPAARRPATKGGGVEPSTARAQAVAGRG